MTELLPKLSRCKDCNNPAIVLYHDDPVVEVIPACSHCASEGPSCESVLVAIVAWNKMQERGHA